MNPLSAAKKMAGVSPKMSLSGDFSAKNKQFPDDATKCSTVSPFTETNPSIYYNIVGIEQKSSNS